MVMEGGFHPQGLPTSSRSQYPPLQDHPMPLKMSSHVQDPNALPSIDQLQSHYSSGLYAAHGNNMTSTSIGPQNPVLPVSASPTPPGQVMYSHHQLQPSAQYRAMGLPLPQNPSATYSEPHHFSSAAAAAQPYFPGANPSLERLGDSKRVGASGFDQYGQAHLANPAGSLIKHEAEPTHVVGQQGRRGILPSAPGKAAPGSVKTVIPEKNDDGKYSCPSCSKTYLHAKHLKRHMLRHTGERPYACKLCKDTFSRSDILKRHFIKCSIRRGVPPDGDHLEGARVHNNRNRLSAGAAADQAYQGAQSTAFDGHGAASAPMVGGIGSYGHASAHGGHDPTAYHDGMTSLSTRSSRSSSLIQASNPLSENRRSASSLELLGSSRTSFDGGADFANLGTLPAVGHSVTAYSMPGLHPSVAAGAHPYAYAMHHHAHDAAANQSSAGEHPDAHMYGQPSHEPLATHTGNIAWSLATTGAEYPMFQGGAVAGSDREMRAHAELLASSAGDGVFSGLYSNSFTPTANLMFDSWGTDDPLDLKAAALLAFCFHNGDGYSPAEEAQLRTFLTAENIKLFIGLFSNFQGHWPMLHMPTFNPATAHDGLLLAIVAIGAIYSDRLDLHQQRLLMEQIKRAVHQSSRTWQLARHDSPVEWDDWLYEDSALEEVQALILVQCLFSWHGNNQQRLRSRSEFWKLALVARRLNLLEPIPAHHPQSSVLHSSNKPVDAHDLTQWQWQAWVEQEKRSRAMYMIWLMDTAMVIFFNCKPQYEPNEVRLQLPCDDAAWEARSPDDCMAALGLRGPDEQQAVNATGSKRARQPEFRLALQLLYDPKKTFQPNSTNIYSKFVLIHALHVQIWNTQRQSLCMQSAAANLLAKLRGGAGTPLSNSDWVNGEHGIKSQPSSGRATPEIGQQAASHAHLVQQLMGAVEKWKSIWDIDVELQYPHQSTPGGGLLSRRKGFCRDAIHFYWLAKMFLNSTRPREWQLSSDHRFHFVMQNLKEIKNWVASEAYKNGKDIGSVVDIGEEYGIQDLTLNMKLLFAPLPLDITE